MKEIREAFHGINNYLHKIMMHAGIVTELAKGKDIDTMKDEELRIEAKKYLETLESVQLIAKSAAETLSELHDRVYELFKIDTTKPIEKR